MFSNYAFEPISPFAESDQFIHLVCLQFGLVLFYTAHSGIRVKIWYGYSTLGFLIDYK